MVESKEEGKVKPITVSDMIKAEKSVLKYVQRQHFTEEISSLKKGQIKKSSAIYKLDPKQVDNLLCVGG